ncbi:MAG: formimidoylglutamase [Gammaproteobacteria bacterium]
MMNLYHPPIMTDWQGRVDARENEYFYQVVKSLDLAHNEINALKGFALLGFECDLGVRRNLGRPGAEAGAHAIKQVLAALPMQKIISIYDAGSIIADDDLAAAQIELGVCIEMILALGLQPIVLGGGHETAWGHYQGLAKYLQQEPLNIVNFDAHFDLRDIPADNIGTSGTSFRQIALDRQQNKLDFNYYCLGIQQTSNTKYLFEIAKQLNTHILLAAEIYKHGTLAIEKFLAPVLYANTPVYLSICLDVFAACFAPGVSAPQALGLQPWQVISALEQLAASSKVISIDIVELAPNYDIDHRTAKLAAQLLSIFMHHKIY